MLARQRQEAILREVDHSGGARVAELVDVLGVSDMTVRRDIEVLAAQGLVLKVYGGATAVGGRSAEELTVVLTGGVRTPSDADAELDSAARRMVSEHVGQLIVAQPLDDQEGNRPRTLQSS